MLKRYNLVEVLRPASGGDCTNGGVSSRSERAILVEGTDAEVKEYIEDCVWLSRVNPKAERFPVLRIVRRVIQGVPYVSCAPVSAPAWPVPFGRGMFGGNFVWSSDADFRREVCEYPIQIHDRYEVAS